MSNTRRTKFSVFAAGIAAALGMTTVGCVAELEDVDSNQPASFEEFEATVYQEPDTGVYIVDGDTPIETREGLRQFYEDYFVSGALIINTVSGTDDKWSNSQKLNLTYCVSQSSFGSNYQRVVDAMNSATGAWESAANVNFVHQSSLDGDCNARTNVVFDVRQVSSGQYLARAFFPSTSRRSRNVLIDTSSFVYDNDPSDPLKLVGILRHELGHALGFRHEHTRPESGVCFENTSWRALTSYDSGSVMHYPQCNGSGDWSLTLTTKDIQGAQAVYGQ